MSYRSRNDILVFLPSREAGIFVRTFETLDLVLMDMLCVGEVFLNV